MADHDDVDPDVRTKALAILRDGRLRVMAVRTDGNGRLSFADAIVHGHRADYAVTFNAAGTNTPAWWCSCRDTEAGQLCTHAFAAEMVCHGIMPPGRDGHPKAKPAPRQRSAGAHS